jgi:hypothetical protein
LAVGADAAARLAEIAKLCDEAAQLASAGSMLLPASA